MGNDRVLLQLTARVIVTTSYIVVLQSKRGHVDFSVTNVCSDVTWLGA